MVKGLQAEEWGGNTGMIEVSAVTKQGLDELVDRIMLESEILELKARPDAPGKGLVVESKQSPEQGVVVTVLVTDGTLRVKDQVVCGESSRACGAMIDDHGHNLQEAGPSTAGDRCTASTGCRTPATSCSWSRTQEGARGRRGPPAPASANCRWPERSAVTLETLSAKLAERDVQEIKVIRRPTRWVRWSRCASASKADHAGSARQPSCTRPSAASTRPTSAWHRPRAR